MEFLVDNFDFGLEGLVQCPPPHPHTPELDPLIEDLVWHFGDYALDLGLEGLILPPPPELEPLMENLVWHSGDYAGRSPSIYFVLGLKVGTRERRDIKKKSNRAIAFE